MIQFLFSVLILLSFSLSPDIASALQGKEAVLDETAESRQTGKFKPGEILVKFRPGRAAAGAERLHKKNRSMKVRDLGNRLGIELIKLSPELDEKKVLDLYRKDPDVEYAEPNYIVRVLETEPRLPGDQYFGYLWSLYNTGQSNAKKGADIGAARAWNITTGSGSIAVAVLDTGIDYNHKDLAGNVWKGAGGFYGFNAITGTDDPLDDNGHGTHVAGIIGAEGDNGIGVVGVSWSVKIISCKFLDAWGYGTVAGAVNCLEYVRSLKDQGVNVVATNNSWSAFGFSKALYDAIRDQADILFIAAAGNDRLDNDKYGIYPAGYDLPNVISVAATDRTDKPAYFSDYGRRTVHIAAPGVDILSLRASGTDFYGDSAHFFPASDPAPGYYIASGTSMAAPHVAGVAALIKAAIPDMKWETLKNVLLAGGDTIPQEDCGLTITAKRVSAYGSLTCENKPVFSALRLPDSLTPGKAVKLSALSIVCEKPAGPVTVTLSGGSVLSLADEGIAPDTTARDGVFAATWTPANGTEKLLFSSPAGSETVTIPAFTIETEYMPEANSSVPYSRLLNLRGGLPPYTWSIEAGELPPGLGLNPLTSEIHGIPAATGIFNFTVRATDSWQLGVSKELSIRVSENPVIEKWAEVFDLGYVKDFQAPVAADREGNTLTAAPMLNPSNGTEDFLLLKYGADGKLLWYRSHDNAGPYGSCDDVPYAVAVDSGGYGYLAGNSFGINCYDTLIKYDPDGNIVWKKTGPEDFVYAIATDGTSLYVTGQKSKHTNPDSWDQTVAKYDLSGNLVWAKSYDTGLSEIGTAIVLDAYGNIYTGGGLCDFSSFGCYDLVIKYDNSGNVLWARTFDAQEASAVSGIAVDTQGNVYAAGRRFNGSNRDYLVLKYNPAGNLLWTKTYDGGSEDYADALAVDDNGDIYLTGYSYNPKGHAGQLTVMLDTSGKVIWTKGVDFAEAAVASGISLDEGGRIHTAAMFRTSRSHEIFTEIYERTSGPLSLSSSLNPSRIGQAVRFTASLRSQPNVLNRTVVFMEGQKRLGTGVLRGKPPAAFFTTSQLSAGTHSITAVYPGSTGSPSSKSLPLEQTVSPEIIIDNGVSGTSYTGLWSVISGDGAYGPNSLVGSNGSTYTWRIRIPKSGDYDVYAWWTASASRSAVVPYTVAERGGTEEIVVDQQSSGSQWNYLGTFTFDAAGGAIIKLTASGRYPVSFSADAIKLVSR